MPRPRNTPKTLGKQATAQQQRERRARRAYNDMVKREDGASKELAHEVIARRRTRPPAQTIPGAAEQRPRKALNLAEEAELGKREAQHRRETREAEWRAHEERVEAARKVSFLFSMFFVGVSQEFCRHGTATSERW